MAAGRRARGVGHRLARVARPLLRRRRPRVSRRARPLGRRGRDAPGEGQPGGRDGPRAERDARPARGEEGRARGVGSRPRPPRPRASLSTSPAILGREPADRNQGFEGIVFRAEAGPPGGGVFHLVHQRKPARLVTLAFDPASGAAHARAPRMISRHPLKPYDDLTAVTWSERLGRLLVIADSADRLLVVSPDGAIDADEPLPGRPAGGAGPRARRRALGRRREAGAAPLPGRRRGPRRHARRGNGKRQRGRRDEAGRRRRRRGVGPRGGRHAGAGDEEEGARSAARLGGRRLLPREALGRLQDRPQGLRPGGLPLLPGLDGRGRERRELAAPRLRVAARAHRPRGRVAAAVVRRERRPRVRRGGRAQGRVGRPAPVEGLPAPRRQHRRCR